MHAVVVRPLGDIHGSCAILHCQAAVGTRAIHVLQECMSIDIGATLAWRDLSGVHAFVFEFTGPAAKCKSMTKEEWSKFTAGNPTLSRCCVQPVGCCLKPVAALPFSVSLKTPASQSRSYHPTPYPLLVLEGAVIMDGQPFGHIPTY